MRSVLYLDSGPGTGLGSSVPGRTQQDITWCPGATGSECAHAIDTCTPESAMRVVMRVCNHASCLKPQASKSPGSSVGSRGLHQVVMLSGPPNRNGVP